MTPRFSHLPSLTTVSLCVGGIALLSASTLLSGCGSSQESPLVEKRWAISNIYLTPENPALTPTGASIAFGQRSAAMTTGCAPIQATVSYQDNTVAFDNLQVGETNESCTGVKRFIHDNLLTLFKQPLTVNVHDDNAVSLTVEDATHATTASLWLSPITE